MKWRRWLTVSSAIGCAAWLAVAWTWGLPLDRAAVQGARWLAAPVAAFAYRADAARAEELAAAALRGGLDAPDVLARWRDASALGITAEPTFLPMHAAVPMVHAARGAPGYEQLRARLDLDAVVAQCADEFAAMLAVGRCVGTAWDHGSDAIPGGPTEFDPIEALDLGRAGHRFHCAIAARTLVHCATAVGFVARTVNLAADGYTPQHTVSEVWSNQFAKWFVLDTDFDVVYLRHGVPLSAYELCHHGPVWRAAGELEVREFAPRKPSLPARDMLPAYASVHLDLRTDWRVRHLARGSPAGGDLATYYTTRPELGRLLTARIHVDDPQVFDWPVNQVRVRLCGVQAEGAGRRLELELAAHAPQFDGFEVRIDEQEWTRPSAAKFAVVLAAGTHRVSARVQPGTRWPGPTTTIEIQVASSVR